MFNLSFHIKWKQNPLNECIKRVYFDENGFFFQTGK